MSLVANRILELIDFEFCSTVELASFSKAYRYRHTFVCIWTIIIYISLEYSFVSRDYRPRIDVSPWRFIPISTQISSTLVRLSPSLYGVELCALNPQSENDMRPLNHDGLYAFRTVIDSKRSNTRARRKYGVKRKSR